LKNQPYEIEFGIIFWLEAILINNCSIKVTDCSIRVTDCSIRVYRSQKLGGPWPTLPPSRTGLEITNLQVFAIELVTFAVDFVPLAVEFGGFAVEFVALVLQFVALAIELDAFAMGLGAFALELAAFALKFIMATMTPKKLTTCHEVNDFRHGRCHLRQKKATKASFTCRLASYNQLVQE